MIASLRSGSEAQGESALVCAHSNENEQCMACTHGKRGARTVAAEPTKGRRGSDVSVGGGGGWERCAGAGHGAGLGGRGSSYATVICDLAPSPGSDGGRYGTRQWTPWVDGVSHCLTDDLASDFTHR